MALRHYRRWETSDQTSYIPRYSSRYYEDRDRYTYLNYRPSSSYRSSAETSGYPGTRNNYNFNFVTGRYTTENNYTRLRDATQPNYYQTVTDLYLASNQLQEDYRNILDRYNTDRSSGSMNYGGGLPAGYGAPKYIGRDRLPPAERYGLNERRGYGSRQYDTQLTNYDYDIPHYERKRGLDYQGTEGDFHYQKDVYKGKYDLHGGSGEHDNDLDGGSSYSRRHDRSGYDTASYGHDTSGYDHNRSARDRYGQDADKYDTNGYDYNRSTRDRYGQETRDRYGQESDKYGYDRDNHESYDRYNDRDVAGQPNGSQDRHGRNTGSREHDANNDLGRTTSGIEIEAHEKKKYDSGIDSPDFSPVAEPEPEPEPVPEPSPEPEICVYNEITAEDYKQIAEELAVEDAKEKPLCAYPLIATVTHHTIQVDKVAGEFKKSDDEDDDAPLDLTPLPTSPHDPIALELLMKTSADIKTSETEKEEVKLQFDMEKSQGDKSASFGAKDITLEMDEPTNPLGVTAGVVQVGEETIITETTEEIITEIPAEETVPAEVTLSLDPVLPEGDNKIIAKPEKEAPQPAKEAEPESTAEIKMTEAAPKEENKKPEPKKIEEASVSLKIDSKASDIITKDEEQKEKPGAPKEEKPAAPKEEKPAAPKQEKPASPKQAKLAAAPKDEKPAAPKQEKPGAPKQAKPAAAPKDEKPAAPKQEKPGAPKQAKPAAAPKNEKPGAPKQAKPAAAPKDEKPGAPKQAKPAAAPKDEKPAAPKEEKSAAPKEEKPATPKKTEPATAPKDEKPATPKKSNKFAEQQSKAPASAPKKKKLW